MNDDQEQHATDAANLAFDRSANYEWCGQPITWSERHNWLWLALARRGNYTNEQIALVAMWVGMITETDGLKDAERAWRRDAETMLDELSGFTGNYYDEAPEVALAVKVYGEIMTDVDASMNDPQGGADAAGAPKKYQAEPVT